MLPSSGWSWDAGDGNESSFGMDIDCLDEKKDDIKESEWQKLELEGDADDKEGASSIASGLAGLGLGALGALVVE